MNNPTSVLPSVPPENRYTPFPPAKSDNPEECLSGPFVVRVITRVADRYYVGRSMVDTSTFRTMTCGMPREDFEQELALQLVINAEKILAAREPAALATTICQRKAVDLYRHHLVISKHEIPGTDEILDEGLPVQGGTRLGCNDKNYCEPAAGQPSGRHVWRADRLFALLHPKQSHHKSPDEIWRLRLLAVENERRLKQAWAAFNLLDETEAECLLYALGFKGTDISSQVVRRSSREIGELTGLPTWKVTTIVRRAIEVLQEACGERRLKRLKKMPDGSLVRVDYRVQAQVRKELTLDDNTRGTRTPPLAEIELAPMQAAV